MSIPKFITQYNRSTDFNDYVLKFDPENDPSKVKESLAYATDINKIYEEYCHTGKAPNKASQPIYDETGFAVDSLIAANDVVTHANDYFMNLPAEIRSHYGNDLFKFATAVTANDPKLSEFGILSPNISLASSGAAQKVDAGTPVSNASQTSAPVSSSDTSAGE